MKTRKLLSMTLLCALLAINLGTTKAQCPNIWPYDTEHIEMDVYDTVVTCENPSIQLQCHYFFTASTYNGQY